MKIPDKMHIDSLKLMIAMMSMSTLACGAYIRILCAMWRLGGSLRCDEDDLSKTARVEKRQWLQIRDQVLKHLWKQEEANGLASWSHPELRVASERARHRSRQNALNARRK